MNRYSLKSDSNRWWWPSAAAGALATACVAAILALPAAGDAIPATPDGGGGRLSPIVITDLALSTSAGHPCYLVRGRWNNALDGPQPVCR